MANGKTEWTLWYSKKFEDNDDNLYGIAEKAILLHRALWSSKKFEDNDDNNLTVIAEEAMLLHRVTQNL